MYRSRIKKQFRNDKKGKTLFSGDEYMVLLDLVDSNKVLIVDKESGLLSDLYKNKLEDPKGAIELVDEVYVEAKSENYANSYNLSGSYMLLNVKPTKQLERGSGITPVLLLKSMNDLDEPVKEIFPSRVRVIEVIQPE